MKIVSFPTREQTPIDTIALATLVWAGLPAMFVAPVAAPEGNPMHHGSPSGEAR